MVQTIARIKKAGKHFEIIVDLDDALKFKKGESSFIEADGNVIFVDSKKGMVAPNSDLNESFGTGLLTFGILSLIIVSIISAYNNLD